MLHPDFKLNGTTFPSSELLSSYALQLIKIGASDEVSVGKFILEWLNSNEFIEVKTSGSTGKPKPIKLLKKHVRNSALATAAFFDLNARTKALLCLPSDYIAGKMMLVRAMIAGWDIYITSPGKNPLKGIEIEFDFAAMVPYQVHHSISEMHKVKKMIVGGGAVSPLLEEKLQHLNTSVYATYGMTETISHIAIRSLNGSKRSSIYHALPDVKFSQNQNSCLQIDAPKISEETVNTNDVVELLSDKSFRLLGRIDNVINTGGVKVHPEQVEEKLATQIKQPFFIASEKDEMLGEKVVLILESAEDVDVSMFTQIFETLSKYEKPKKVLTTPTFIYTETGKIKRKAVLNRIYTV